MAMPSILKRPSRLREEAKDQGRNPIMSGPEIQATEKILENIEAVRAMLDSPGWKVVRKYLTFKSSQAWDKFRDPRVTDEQAAILRREAIKYSGIQDVVEEIMATKGNQL
jgi:hypothetical protein